MKSRLLLPGALALMLAAGPAGAQEPTVAVHTSAGFMYGLAKELVYSGTFTLSELEWQLQPVFYEQSTLDVRAFNGLHATLSVRTGIPAQSGIMTDSDWLNYDSTKTNFSQSNSFTDRAVYVDVRVGWEVAASKAVRVEPFLSFGYMSWKWSGRDGYLQYPPNWFTGTPSQPYPPYTQDTPISVYGTGIVYEQTYFIPGAGARLAVDLSDRWDISAIITVSPYVFCNSLDTHIFRGEDFSDVMAGGWMIEPELSVAFSFSPRMSLSLDASFRHIWNLLGTETVTVSGVDYTGAPTPTPGSQSAYADSAGAGFDALSVALTFALAL